MLFFLVSTFDILLLKQLECVFLPLSSLSCVHNKSPLLRLLENCRKHVYLARTGENFVTLVVRLLERLLDYRTIMHDENKENRMSCTVNVLVRWLLLLSNTNQH